MKKHLLILIVILPFYGVFAQNLDFEIWTQDTVLMLDGYNTTSNEYPAIGDSVVIRSTDSYLNSYSLKLKTIDFMGDTVFGYFMNGDPESFTGGEPTALAGVDSIIGYYKYDIQANDSALIVCVPKFMGTPTGGGIMQITGTQSTWKRFSFAIDAASADTVIIAAASSNAMIEHCIPGSWLMLDDVHLKYSLITEPIVNFDFENWTDAITEDLAGWVTSNRWLLGSPTLPVVKTTDSYNGTYAAELTTMVSMYNDTMPGMINNGEWGNNGPEGGVPYTDEPHAIELHYKYVPAGTDTAFLSFQFKSLGATIAYHGGHITQTAATYTLWSQAVSLPSTPDTLLIVMSSGNVPDSKLTIDSLGFLTLVGVNNDYSISEFIVYPIPSNNNLNFKFSMEKDNDITIKVYDIIGSVMVEKEYFKSIGEHRISIDIGNLSSGTYIYEIRIGDNVHSKQFIKN